MDDDDVNDQLRAAEESRVNVRRIGQDQWSVFVAPNEYEVRHEQSEEAGPRWVVLGPDDTEPTVILLTSVRDARQKLASAFGGGTAGDEAARKLLKDMGFSEAAE